MVMYFGVKEFEIFSNAKITEQKSFNTDDEFN